MNARKSMSIIGAVAVAVVGSASLTAYAGIDAGGSTKPKETVSKGKVTGFGSIYVNGIRYATDQASFIINGELGQESDLSVGQVVTVIGTADAASGEGVAVVVIRDDAVEGPVDAINTGAGTLSVLGQKVLLAADTSFDDEVEDLDELDTGDIVRVSGFRNADGDIVASRIEAAGGETEFDLTGAVASVDTASGELLINNLVVDYSAANLFGLGAGMPVAGEQVRVRGSNFDATGALLASAVSATGNTAAISTGSDAEIEGLITGTGSLGEFELDGLSVQYDEDTEFENGSVFGLVADQRAEVEGWIDEHGVLRANKVRFAPSSDLEIDGTVELVLGSMFVVDGALLKAMPETAWEDDSSVSDRYFNVSELRTGDRVNVQGYTTGNGVNATRVVRRD